MCPAIDAVPGTVQAPNALVVKMLSNVARFDCLCWYSAGRRLSHLLLVPETPLTSCLGGPVCNMCDIPHLQRAPNCLGGAPYLLAPLLPASPSGGECRLRES